MRYTQDIAEYDREVVVPAIRRCQEHVEQDCRDHQRHPPLGGNLHHGLGRSCCRALHRAQVATLRGVPPEDGEQLQAGCALTAAAQRLAQGPRRRGRRAYQTNVSGIVGRGGLGPIEQRGRMQSPVPAVVVALVLASPAMLQAAGPRVSVHKVGRVYSVAGTLAVAATDSIIWAVLTDYDDLGAFVPEMTRSVVVARDSDSTLTVEQFGETHILIFRRPTHLILRVTERPMRRLSFERVDGDFERYEGVWELAAAAESTEVHFTLVAVPDFFVPAFVGKRVLAGRGAWGLLAVASEVTCRGRKRR